VNTAKASAVVEQARKSGRGVLSATDVYTIFEAYGIPVAGWNVVDSPDAAVAAADAIGYPVVVKVDARRSTTRATWAVSPST